MNLKRQFLMLFFFGMCVSLSNLHAMENFTFARLIHQELKDRYQEIVDPAAGPLLLKNVKFYCDAKTEKEKKMFMKIIDIILKTGVNVNCTESRTKGTALHIAAEKNNLEIAKKFIEKDAYIDQPNLMLYAPIHIAIICHNYEIVKYFLLNDAALPKGFAGVTTREIKNLLRKIEDFIYVNSSVEGDDPALNILYSGLDKDPQEVMLYLALTNKKYRKSLFHLYGLAKKYGKENDLRELFKLCEKYGLKNRGWNHDLPTSVGQFNERFDANLHYLK